MSAVVWLEDLDVGDVETAGGKGANLGELTRTGLPVPRGFVVTADAYLRAMADGGVRDELDEVARSIDVDDDQALVDGASRLQDLVRKAGLGVELRAEIVDAYGRLHTGRVAVRSSVTAEDTSDSSFAGMNQTFTNIAGTDDLCARIVDCWASLYGARVVAYRRSRASLTRRRLR
jgi:pyruvate,water dikinase